MKFDNVLVKKVEGIEMKLHLLHKDKISVIVAGCGRFGSCLASSLNEKGYDVTIIDKQEQSFERLNENFSGFQICGDVCDLDTIKYAGVERCAMFIAVTDDDNTNCMAAQIANRIFHIDDVYVRLNDPDKEDLLRNTNIKAIYPVRLSEVEFERISSITLGKDYAK